MVWSESKPRVLPLLLSLVYALVARLNVDAWREQDQFFVERDPQLAYPAHPSTVSNTHLVLTGCVLPFVLIFGLAAWAHTRVGPDAAVVWWTHQSFALGNALLVAMGTFNAGKAFVGRLRPNFFAACDYKGGYAAALAEFQEAKSSALFAAYLAATEPGAVGDRAECRAAAAETDEASLSFPSGHAAIAFAGMTRLAAAVVGAGWLAGRRDAPSASLPTEDDEPRGEADAPSSARTAERRERCDGEGASRDAASALGGFAPRDAWYLHAAGRVPRGVRARLPRRGVPIVDYKHRPADVVAGALVGIAAAAACDGGVSGGAFPSSGVGRKRGGGGSRARTRRGSPLPDSSTRASRRRRRGTQHSRATFSSLGGVFDENARYTSTAV